MKFCTTQYPQRGDSCSKFVQAFMRTKIKNSGINDIHLHADKIEDHHAMRILAKLMLNPMYLYPFTMMVLMCYLTW